MKLILYILLITSPIIGMAQTATEGGYIVVRGAVKDCLEWPHRILDVVKIKNQAPITILEISGFSVVGLSRSRLENKLSEAITKITGKSPDSLTVDILASDEEYQIIVKEYLNSLRMLVNGKCPFPKTNEPEKIQKELEVLSKRIAASGTYNKSFKFFPHASWHQRTWLHHAS